jgi:hypothetical protein
VWVLFVVIVHSTFYILDCPFYYVNFCDQWALVILIKIRIIAQRFCTCNFCIFKDASHG